MLVPQGFHHRRRHLRTSAASLSGLRLEIPDVVWNDPSHRSVLCERDQQALVPLSARVPNKARWYGPTQAFKAIPVAAASFANAQREAPAYRLGEEDPPDAISRPTPCNRPSTRPTDVLMACADTVRSCSALHPTRNSRPVKWPARGQSLQTRPRGPHQR